MIELLLENIGMMILSFIVVFGVIFLAIYLTAYFGDK